MQWTGVWFSLCQEFLCAVKFIGINVQFSFFKKCHWLKSHFWSKYCSYLSSKWKRLLTTLNNLKKWATQALMSCSTSSCHTEGLTQLWQSELKKSVKKEMKGGKKYPFSDFHLDIKIFLIAFIYCYKFCNISICKISKYEKVTPASH